MVNLLIVCASVLLVVGSGSAGAKQCACITSNLNVRNQPGTSGTKLGLITAGQCVPYLGQQQNAGSYTWYQVTYKGKSAWVASNWVNLKTCPSTPTSTGGSSTKGQTTGECDGYGVQVISRKTWGARTPTSTRQMTKRPVNIVFIHHTAGGTCSSLDSCSSQMRGTQNYHMNSRKYSDIGYNFLVGEDGRVYEGRGWTRSGGHTLNFNNVAIAISFMGNYMERQPPARALAAAQKLITCGVARGYVARGYTLHGHKDSPTASTACPGTKLYALIKSWSHYTAKKPALP